MQFFAFGETLLDLITDKQLNMVARPGGSQFNIAANLAVSGFNVQLISIIGDDDPGQIIASTAQKAGIGVDFLQRNKMFKTALAFAIIDDSGMPSYTFYKDYPEPLFMPMSLPSMTSESCFSFGSMAALEKQWQPTLSKLMQLAQEAGALIFYDPNIRTQVNTKDEELLLLRNMRAAHIVRGSDEDFFALFGTADPKIIFEKAALQEDRLLFVTQGPEEVLCYQHKKLSRFAVPLQKPLSTVGAGDAFNSGLLAFLAKSGMSAKQIGKLTEEDLGMMTAMAVSFSADVCRSKGNTISDELAQRIAAF
ncbi:MAG: PfkB family carbohydrate kinase [Bacteroidetes bacterium]|jgi:fructokinase|nr:PfkB family carbohydrate kinase [Bacteroidota bacterium]